MNKMIYFFFVALLVFSCRHGDSNPNLDNSINLNLTFDDGINITGEAKIELSKGITWLLAKSEVDKKVSCNKGYEGKIYHLKDINGEVLKDEYVFDKDTTIFIESLKGKWAIVKYENLEDYLSNKAKAGKTNYIWLVEVEPENLQGIMTEIPPRSSDLGNILKSNPNINVALKFDEKIENLERMDATFLECKNLVAIDNIPVGVKSLESCFGSCLLLEEINNIPNTVTNLKNCFNSCASLKKAPTILQGVKNMSHCFAFCSGLEEVPILPKTVTDLEGCFLSCANLKKVPEIPENVTNLASTFMMTALEEMPEIPSKVENMMFCFSACKSLTKTKSIPASVRDMRNTFWDCEKITSINLNCKYNNEEGGATPKRKGYFFESTFLGCIGLKENSISVPSAYLEDYKKGATNMKIEANCFVGK